MNTCMVYITASGPDEAGRIAQILQEDRPRFLDHCVQCMRCYAFCPESAIIMPGKSFARYRSVNADDLLIQGARITRHV